MKRRGPALVLSSLLVAPSWTGRAFAQDPAPEALEVWLCPDHRGHPGDGPGACSRCGRTLEPRKVALVWACPMHPEVTAAGGGACSRCGMPLVSMTQELRWHCPDHGEERSEPGRCPKDGRPLIVRPVALPHGDHNPRHGGILFMAPDGFHHLEGALDSAGRFRLYLYDDFTRPLDARRFRARAGGRALMPSGDGGFLVLPEVFEKGRPVELTVHVAFPTSSPEARFDFVLEAPRANALAPLPPVPASADSAALLEGVRLRRRRLEELVRGGAWPDLYLPALEAKDLALLLLDREGDRVAGPVKTLVRAGWLLDLHGDLGRREEVERAHRLFAQGVTDLEAALAR